MPQLKQVQVIGLANRMATDHGLDGRLVSAMIYVESGANPHAMRFEPAFRWLWPKRDAVVAPPGVSRDTEINQQMTSWGLMQVMGSVYRELGYAERFIGGVLCDPAAQVEYGCKYLARLFTRWPDDWDAVAAYNAGSPRRQEDGSYENQPYVDKVRSKMIELGG